MADRAKPKGLFVLSEGNHDLLYALGAAEAIGALVNLVAERQDADSAVANCPQLADVELLFTGWGAPTLDEAFLAAAPKLKVVFYGAGSVRSMVTDASWDRGVRIVSAWAANAVPVIEYAFAQIILGLKLTWHFVRDLRREGAWSRSLPVFGANGSTVGIISLGKIGRGVCERLKQPDVNVIAYDPFVAPADAAAMGAELVSLKKVFARADVVSLHAPNLPETRGLITGAHLASMKPYATFINTARGAIVREAEMIGVLQDRPDLMAVLDVTDPEPPAEGSPLWSLANVALTPHIAGSMGGECARMGWLMVDDLNRYLAGEPLAHEITREQAAKLA
ncbi:MAG: hydroxyacid dehydrogenase [Phycisphaerae bacterium]|nr:hydroxyacid dehydrogenase [Phycisphaerae bacterium]